MTRERRLRGGVVGLLFLALALSGCNTRDSRVFDMQITGNGTATVGESVMLQIVLDVNDPSGNGDVAGARAARNFAWTLLSGDGTTSVDGASVGPSPDDPASAVFVASRAGDYLVSATGTAGRGKGYSASHHVVAAAPAQASPGLAGLADLQGTYQATLAAATCTGTAKGTTTTTDAAALTFVVNGATVQVTMADPARTTSYAGTVNADGSFTIQQALSGYSLVVAGTLGARQVSGIWTMTMANGSVCAPTFQGGR